jgi:hypothetical protein
VIRQELHTPAYAVANEYDDRELLRRLYDDAESIAERSVLRSLRRTHQEYAAEIARLTAIGDYAAVLLLADQFSTKIGQAVAAEYEQAFSRAATKITRSLADGIKVQVSYSGTNPRAARHLAEKSAQMILEISQDQRMAIRAILDDAFASGINPKKAAKYIANNIGLTTRQTQAVINYRNLLTRGSQEALDRALRDPRFDPLVRSQNLTPADIDRMVANYQRNYIHHRARVIARTEMLAATNAGANEAYTQAIESGSLDQYEYVREWGTAHDERVRGSHRSMHGQVRPYGEKFLSGAGNLLQYPHDPAAPLSERIQCRCFASTRFRLAIEDERNELLQV